MSAVDLARKLVSEAKEVVIRAEQALSLAILRREEAEAKLVQVESEDNCCGVCP